MTVRFLDSKLSAKMLAVPFSFLKAFVLPFIESTGAVQSIDAIFRSYQQLFYIHKDFDYPLLLRKNMSMFQPFGSEKVLSDLLCPTLKPWGKLKCNKTLLITSRRLA